MPAVIRVKRRIDEEPYNGLILNGKRRRLEVAANEPSNNVVSGEEGKDEVAAVLKFAGTITMQDDVLTHIGRLTKSAATERAEVSQKMRKPVNFTEKARDEKRISTKENRFRVVNCLRAILPEAEESNEEITILDVQKNERSADNEKQREHSTNTVDQAAIEQEDKSNKPHVAEESVDYVYDFYIAEDENHVNSLDFTDNNNFRIRTFDDLVFEDSYQDEDDDEFDSEDSNQENYYTNDYPDEGEDISDEYYDDEGHDEFYSDDDELQQMCHEVEKFIIDDDDEEHEEYAETTSQLEDSSDDDDYLAYQDPYEEEYCDARDDPDESDA